MNKEEAYAQGPKLCNKCKVLKERSAFSFHRYKNSYYIRAECKECTRIRDKAWRIRNIDHVRMRERSPTQIYHQKIWYKNRHSLVDTLKANPCMDCGGSFPPECMDFDHVRGTKVKSVSGMLVSHFSLAQLLEEIDKCELVCANCHRTRTKSRRAEPH